MPSRALWGSWTWRFLLSPISFRQVCSLHDLPWVPKGRFEQLLIKGGAARKPPEARLKGPEKLIKIRKPDHLRPCTQPNPVSNPTLLKLCRRMQDCYCPDPYHIPMTTTPAYITSPYSPVRGYSSWGASLLCSLSAWQRNKATLSFSSITLSPYFYLTSMHREPRFWHQ